MMYLQTLFVALFLNFIVAEDCTSFKNCNTCISSNLHCIWCTDERTPDDNRPRCESRDKLNDHSWCKHHDNPKTKNETIQLKNSQLQPSLININARSGDTVTFTMSYKPKLKPPIDIYYLFDNSHTMTDYKKDLYNEATKIYDELKKISDNVHFGVGSFVEKLAEPLASDTRFNPDRLNTFNNHLSLTENISLFVDTVKLVNSTSNLDSPESGLDALMQVLVCDQINWRKDAKRVIIFTTDDTYHSAGDGEAVGAFLPNDMKCHLINSTDPYSSHMYPKEDSLRFDYPSVRQIGYQAQMKNIYIFFSATKNVKDDYTALANAIQSAKYIELEVNKKEDARSTLAETISKEYKMLTQSFRLPRPKVPPHLDLTFSPDCETKDACVIPQDNEIQIDVSVTVKSCPTEDSTSSTLIIAPAGTEGNLTISVDVICQCDCESTPPKNKSNKCRPENVTDTSRGFLQCGVCKCDENWYGKDCSCSGHSTDEEDLSKCKVSDNDKEVCSGRGACRCGQCDCPEGYKGDHCQYKDNACPDPNNQVCANNGKCEQEKCICYEGWQGPDCTCTLKTDMCVGANGQICTGRGDCKCGACTCYDSNKYSGSFCEQCDTCVEDRCRQLDNYVICIYDGVKEKDKQTCDKEQTEHNNVIEVKLKNKTEIDAWSDGNYCEKVLDDKSIIMYKYYDGNNYTKIWIQREKKSPPVTNIWIPIGSAVGGILLIGVLTLIAWKVLVDMMDAREYRRFAEEAQKSGYEVMENPLYKPAAVNVNNPAYEHH